MENNEENYDYEFNNPNYTMINIDEIQIPPNLNSSSTYDASYQIPINQSDYTHNYSFSKKEKLKKVCIRKIVIIVTVSILVLILILILLTGLLLGLLLPQTISTIDTEILNKTGNGLMMFPDTTNAYEIITTSNTTVASTSTTSLTETSKITSSVTPTIAFTTSFSQQPTITKSLAASHEISSDFITNWGDWYPYETCKGSTTGFVLKVEDSDNVQDDTALNGIGIICNTNGVITTITSGVGINGNWKSSSYCPTSQRLIGFRMRAESEQGYSDDTAANDVEFKCSDGTILKNAGGGPWGDWGSWKECQNGYSIREIKTQVEPDGGKNSDDTALNNVVFKCTLD